MVKGGVVVVGGVKENMPVYTISPNEVQALISMKAEEEVEPRGKRGGEQKRFHHLRLY